MKHQNYFSRFTVLIYLSLFSLNPSLVYGQAPESSFECGVISGFSNCLPSETDLPDYIPTSADRVKTIRVAFHIMQNSAANPQNFEAGNANYTAYLMNIFNRVNELFTTGGPYACNGVANWINPVDLRIRVELVGIYYHPDPIGFVNYDGTLQNEYCENNYGICNVLDVYFCQIFAAGASGYGPGKWVGMYKYFDEYTNNLNTWWGAGNSLGHEIGHCLSLYHSWQCDQKCRFPDICQGGPLTGAGCGNNCLNLASDDGCYGSNESYCQPYLEGSLQPDWTCSTNFMSYARIKNHISPLQMAAMHKHLLNDNAEMLKQEYSDAESITITQPNEIWNISKVMYGNIYIEPGAKLTIKKKVLMPPGGRIVVKRGARLVVDGGHLTTKGPAAQTCNGEQFIVRWQGIEVWGNTNVTATAAMLEESYLPALSDPGLVILRSNAKIEKAQIGIQTAQNGPYGWLDSKVLHFNGLINAAQSTFLNCRKGVEFLAHTAPIDNPSKFVQCKFIQNYLPSPSFNYEGVTQWQVKGIQYTGCEFNRLKLGIATINASFLVSDSDFKTCERAVMVDATSPMFAELTVVGGALTTNGNRFENCLSSVTSNAYNFLQVSNNNFKNCLFGVQIDGSGGFQITDNVFEHTADGTLLFNAGISAINTGILFNFAECNRYLSFNDNTRINVGISAMGNNRNFTFRKEDFDCRRDVQVLKANLAGGAGFILGEISDQGTFTNAVRNLFTGVIADPNAPGGFKWSLGHLPDIFTTTPNPTPPQVIESKKFFYYYPPTAPVESRMVPKCPRAGFGILPLCTQQYNFDNQKPTNDGSTVCGTRIIKDFYNGPPKDCRSVSCLYGYYPNIRRADSLLNLGNVTQLFTMVQSSPNSSTTLQMLNDASPYLSDNLLNAVAVSATMSSTNKGTVLNANTPLPMYLLPTWASYLPTTLYNQLINASNTTTLSTRNLLESGKAEDERNKAALLGFLTDSLYSSGNYAQVEALLQNDPERQSREALVGLKIQRQNYSAAQALLNAYPTTDPEDGAFHDVQNINLRRITQNITFQLTAQEDTFLHHQAYAYGAQTGYARSLLYLIKGELFDRTIPLPETTENREEVVPVVNLAELKSSIFELQPNPAKEELKLIFPGWQEGTPYQAQMYDLTGKLMLTTVIRSVLSVLDLSSLSSGIYLVCIRSNGSLIATKKLVKQ